MKTGTSLNGHIENTNRAKAIACDCKVCYWSKITRYGDIFCRFYKRNNPNKEKCKRFETKLYNPMEDKGKKKCNPPMAKDITSYYPAFPWERKIGGNKND